MIKLYFSREGSYYLVFGNRVYRRNQGYANSTTRVLCDPGYVTRWFKHKHAPNIMKEMMESICTKIKLVNSIEIT